MQDDLLELVRRWLVQARSLRPEAGGPIVWTADADGALLMDAVLTQSVSASDASHHYYESFFGGVSPKSRQILERAVDWLLADFHRRGIDPTGIPGVEESALFRDIRVPERHGRRLTADLLVLLDLALQVKHELQPRRADQVIIEVGGGYGEMARLLRVLSAGDAPYTHLLLDVPDALALAYLFLAQTFPAEPMLLASSGAQLRETDLSKYRFVFVPAALANDLAGRRVDLVLSTALLGGPQASGIRGWTSFAQQTVRADKIIALDRLFNTTRPGLAPWRPDTAPSATVYDAHWQVVEWEIEPSYLRCPYATRLHPRCVQIVAKRAGAMGASQAHARAAELLADVRDSLWCRHLDGETLDGTCWDNLMIHDGGMNGTTFKLWESIRLCPGPANLRLMIQHIDHLQRNEGKWIEETAFYEHELSRVVAECSDLALQTEFATWMWDRLRDRPDPASMANYLRVILPQCKGQRIVCYGVGRDFEAMANAGIFAGSQVVGLIDDKRPPGNEVCGFKVFATADLPALKPDVILATSSRFGAALRERATGMVTALGLKAQVK